MPEILIVGAGPAGLTMALELARHGKRCRIIDKLPEPLPFCRAIGITPRTLEVWEDMGVVRDMIEAGIWFTGLHAITPDGAKDMVEDLSDLPYATFGLPQYSTEEILTHHLSRRGIEIERGAAITSLTQTDGKVLVTIEHADGSKEEAEYRYVVGCDGAHSFVRRAVGIAFEGEGFPFDFMLGDVEIDWDLPRGKALFSIRPKPGEAPDMFVAIPLPEPNRYRVSMKAPPELAAPDKGTDHGIQSERPAPGIEHLQAVADDLLPEETILSDMRWSSIFRISMRIASHYRKGNVFLAGDAAHIHPPTGGQGMNTGIQDAYNLAWKMALDDPSLLDTYEAERRPVGVDVLERTVAASKGMERTVKKDRLADTQMLIRYAPNNWIVDDLPGTNGPLPGERAPDCMGLRQQGVHFPQRLHELLRSTAFVVLIDARQPGKLDEVVEDFSSFGWPPGSLRIVAVVGPDAELSSPYHVQVVRDDEGTFAKTYLCGDASEYLIRPDGYIGWRGKDWHDSPLFQNSPK
jgi:2-polyprenyl-6-methoxyphenol hydroxylase-like FAD-dependent oxidoreductase